MAETTSPNTRRAFAGALQDTTLRCASPSCTDQRPGAGEHLAAGGRGVLPGPPLRASQAPARGPHGSGSSRAAGGPFGDRAGSQAAAVQGGSLGRRPRHPAARARSPRRLRRCRPRARQPPNGFATRDLGCRRPIARLRRHALGDRHSLKRPNTAARSSSRCVTRIGVVGEQPHHRHRERPPEPCPPRRRMVADSRATLGRLASRVFTPEPRSIVGHSSSPRLPSIAPPSDRQDSAALPPSAENDQQHTEQAEARGLPRASPGIRAWPEPADEAAPPAPRVARIA